MTKPLKLFFDECVSTKFPPRLLELYSEDYPHLEATHLAEHFKKGASDAEWIPRAAKEGWIIVTRDKRGSDKLPKLCEKYNATHMIMPGKLTTMRHKAAFYCLWPQIVQIPLLPKGTRVFLCFRDNRYGTMPLLETDNMPLSKWCKKNNIKFVTKFL